MSWGRGAGDGDRGDRRQVLRSRGKSHKGSVCRGRLRAGCGDLAARSRMDLERAVSLDFKDKHRLGSE